jgi:hypothetical protein
MDISALKGAASKIKRELFLQIEFFFQRFEFNNLSELNKFFV